MRVLNVIDSLSASGGAEHGMVREISHFSDQVDQRVVRLFAKDDLEQLLREREIPVVALGLDSSAAGWNWPVAAKRLGEVVDEFSPDVIHSSLFTSNIVAQLAGRRRSIPVLSTFTLSGDRDLLRKYQPGADSWKASVLRSVAGYCARGETVRFRALTRDALETNCRLLRVDPARAEVIPRGRPENLQPEVVKSRAELGLPVEVPLLINVGRQTAQKGHLALLEAYKIIRQSTPAHLVILGREGDTTGALNTAISESGLGDQVTVVAYTPDVAHYLAHASVFVFSSYMEGLGTAVIEAMASGVPVVAFDIPPVREATGDGRFGSLVPTGDVAALSAEVAAVLRQGSDRTQRAKEWVDENYSMQKVADRVERLLAEVAGGS